MNEETGSQLKASYLSPSVEELVCQIPKWHLKNGASLYSEDRSIWISEYGCINWNSVTDYKGNYDDINYPKAIEESMPLIYWCSRFLSELDESSILTMYKDALDWTSSVQLIENCIHLYKEYIGVNVNMIIQLLAMILERSLGDLALNLSKDCSQCVMNFRSLLQCKKLESFVGRRVFYLLLIFVGTPEGLNLRNLVWHGFPFLGELLIEYAAVLIILLPSIGQLLNAKGYNHGIHRNKISLSPFAEIINQELCLDEVALPCPELVFKIFKQSYFVPLGMVRSWMHAFALYNNAKPGYSLVALLPLIEHGLRCLYCVVNGCSRRIQTAEVKKQFTTMVELFSAAGPDKGENALPQVLGQDLWNLLLDVFHRPEGPRVRDRISHGEVDVLSLSNSMAKQTWLVALTLCVRFSHVRGTKERENNSLGRQLSCLSERYKPLFSTNALLVRELRQCLQDLRDTELVSLNSEEDDSLVSPEVITICQNIEKTAFLLLARTGGNGLSLIVGENLSHFIVVPTLSFHQLANQDTQETGVLRHVISNVCASIHQLIRCFQDWKEQYQLKKLRSRRRKSYAILKRCAPRLLDGCVLLAAIVSSSLQGFKDDKHQRMPDTLKYLKKILQFSENIRSLTCPAKNRWFEATSYVLELQYFVKEKCCTTQLQPKSSS